VFAFVIFKELQVLEEGQVLLLPRRQPLKQRKRKVERRVEKRRKVEERRRNLKKLKKNPKNPSLKKRLLLAALVSLMNKNLSKDIKNKQIVVIYLFVCLFSQQTRGFFAEKSTLTTQTDTKFEVKFDSVCV
jgi:hypothetical protein